MGQSSRVAVFVVGGSEVIVVFFDREGKQAGSFRMRAINVVVTCTKRKTRPVPLRLRLRSVNAQGAGGRVTQWVHRLESVAAQHVTATALYAGDQWQVAKSLPSL